MKIRIGYIIKKYREAHNYDQASLARLARLTRGKVVYIENDKSTQKEEQLEKLAGTRLYKKPTTGEFIDILANYLNLNESQMNIEG